MTMTAEMILTDFGTKLPLDQRRRDALAAYARGAAHHAAARGAQGWVEREWGLKAYEAKDLLKGNASETVWERILKHPRGRWRVALPVLGAVIGQSLEDHITQNIEEARREREQFAAREARLVRMETHLRGRPSVGGVGRG